MVIPAIRDTPLILDPQTTDTQATLDAPPIPVLQTMDTQARRNTPLILVLQTTDTQAAQGILLIPVPQATDTQATLETPPIPVLQTTDIQARRGILPIWHLDTRAARHPTLVPVMDTPWRATPAIEPRSRRLCDAFWLRFRPKIHPRALTSM
jgi:hypothetical protein